MKVFYDGKEVGNFYDKTKGEIISSLITKMDENGKPMYPDINKYEFQSTVDEKHDQCTEYIYRHYPQEKQNSDIADKIYFEAVLRARGVDNIDAQLVNAVVDFYNGKSIEDIISEVEDDDKTPYIQLLKLGIRVTWVQRCKEEYFLAKTENRELDLPKFPL